MLWNKKFQMLNPTWLVKTTLRASWKPELSVRNSKHLEAQKSWLKFVWHQEKNRDGESFSKATKGCCCFKEAFLPLLASEAALLRRSRKPTAAAAVEDLWLQTRPIYGALPLLADPGEALAWSSSLLMRASCCLSDMGACWGTWTWDPPGEVVEEVLAELIEQEEELQATQLH